MTRINLLLTTSICGALGLSIAANTASASDLPDSNSPPIFTKPGVAELPAVDGINGKFGGFGGGTNFGSIGIGNGSLSAPLPFLGRQFGTQFDGSLGEIAGQFYGSISNHTFWRDPSVGLIGVFGNYSRLNALGGVNIEQGAVEGEAYLGQFTLRGLAGFETGNSGFYNFGTQKVNIATRFFDKADIEWYAEPDTGLYVGHRYTGGLNAAAFGI